MNNPVTIKNILQLPAGNFYIGSEWSDHGFDSAVQQEIEKAKQVYVLKINHLQVIETQYFVSY